MKLNKLVLKVTSMFVLFVMMFTLSSNNKDPYTSDINDFCASVTHDEDGTQELRIKFLHNGGYTNIPNRYTNYDQFIPNEDLRNNYPNPSTSLGAGMTSYYCFVKVTTPNCLDWVYTTRMSNTNGGGDGIFTIRVPRPENFWDVTILVKYYEICSNGIYSDLDSTVKYSREITFLGGLNTNVPEPFDLFANYDNFNCNNLDVNSSVNGGTPIESIFDTIEIEQP